MGCDIHMTVERLEGDGFDEDRRPLWQSMSPPKDEYGDYEWPEDRNYTVFAALADVRRRDTGTPISKPRGIPEDASGRARRMHDEWSSDGHSHSWLLLSEVLPHIGEWWHDWGDWLRSLPAICEAEPDHIRLVFFFDN